MALDSLFDSLRESLLDVRIRHRSVDSAPSLQYAAAVERARDLVRAAVVEHNLPGVSVAVGAGGMGMSLRTERDRSIVIAVASHMAHANTSSLALRIGEAFAERTR